MRWIDALVVVCAASSVALAQHNYARTFVVDPSGNGDFTTIQSAIDSINPIVPPGRQAIVINAGLYAEAVLLNKPLLDLVGVDRDSVVVQPPPDTDAITIRGDGVRGNTIANLTILTDDDTIDEGRGIVIEHNTGSSEPSDIEVRDVFIRCAGRDSPAIEAADECGSIRIVRVVIRNLDFSAETIQGTLAHDVRVLDCDFSAHDGRMKVGDDWLIQGCFLETRAVEGSGGGAEDDTAPVEIRNASNIEIHGCVLRGRGHGIVIGDESSNILVTGSDLFGTYEGARLVCGTGIVFDTCRIAADSRNATVVSEAFTPVSGVLADTAMGCGTLSGVVLSECEILAFSDNALRDAVGVDAHDRPLDGPVRVLNCTISAEVSATGKRAIGVWGRASECVAVVGGSIDAIDADERQTERYDVLNESATEPRVLTSGVEYSRWKGAVGAAVGQDATVQRVVNLQSAGAGSVLIPTALIGAEQEVFAGFVQPDNFRVLSVTLNQGSLTSPVIIVGRDWALRPIADAITLGGPSTVSGVKAFREVTKVILPAQTAPGQTVSVGTTNILGLHAPISETGDFQQLGRKTALGTSYIIQPTLPLPNIDRGTVDVSTFTPANLDSYEITYRASR